MLMIGTDLQAQALSADRIVVDGEGRMCYAKEPPARYKIAI